MFAPFATLEDQMRYTDYVINRPDMIDEQAWVPFVTREYFAAHIRWSDERIIQRYIETHPAPPRPIDESTLKYYITIAMDVTEEALTHKKNELHE